MLARITAYIPPDLDEEIRVLAVRRRLTLSDVVAEALADWLRIQQPEAQQQAQPTPRRKSAKGAA